MSLISCDGRVLESDIGGAFTDGFGPVNETFCLENGLGGLIVEVSGGDFLEDVSWSLMLPSGDVKSGIAGTQEFGACISPFPSPQPSISSKPTKLCEFYTIELYDVYGDG